MAIVSITEAAKLVRRGRATLYRDIDKGRLSKSVSSVSGETGIETSELVRAYGKLYLGETGNGVRDTSAADSIADAADSIADFEAKVVSWGQRKGVSSETDETLRDTDRDTEQIQILQERIKNLERVIALEADLRRVKDEVAVELRARLADKDAVIKVLESKVLLLEYTKPAEEKAPEKKAPGFFARLFNRG